MIFDIEGDSLTPTKIHCLSYTFGKKIYSTTSYDKMRRIILSADILIGHNIIRFDIPVLERILNIKIKARLIDTLALSWYLNHNRIRHGLESYGEEFGVPKPEILDWENLTIDHYIHRCEEDVKITTQLWDQLKSKLMKLYESKKEADRLLDYLSFKLTCARKQEEVRWKLDVKLAQDSLDTLLKEEAVKIDQLKKVLPPTKVYAVRKKPAKPFKMDGTPSTTGAKWKILLREQGLPPDHNEDIKIVVGENEANPNSEQQVKDWLYSLGWIPESFVYVKDKQSGTERTVPQVRVEEEIDNEKIKVLCPSVKKLIEKEPAIELLEGLSIIQHRITVFNGFLENHEDGYLKAEIAGLTNTLRFKHKTIVNLPGVNRPWGKEIRGSLIAPDGYIICGSDMVSLEETTKKHYMWDYDPEFVTEMSRKGFDAHLDLAKHAGAVTQQEIDDYIGKVSGAKNLKPIRANYKVANYACIYGVGAPKLARNTGLSLREARKLIEAYWKRNWAVKALVETLTIKNIDGEMWLFNPVSKLYYSLRYLKDAFSTLNQGTGVYCFDKWISCFFYETEGFTAQFHDEIVLVIKQGEEEQTRHLLKTAIKRTNEKLKLNLLLDVDIKFGLSYAEVH